MSSVAARTACNRIGVLMFSVAVSLTIGWTAMLGAMTYYVHRFGSSTVFLDLNAAVYAPGAFVTFCQWKWDTAINQRYGSQRATRWRVYTAFAMLVPLVIVGPFLTSGYLSTHYWPSIHTQLVLVLVKLGLIGAFSTLAYATIMQIAAEMESGYVTFVVGGYQFAGCVVLLLTLATDFEHFPETRIFQYLEGVAAVTACGALAFYALDTMTAGSYRMVHDTRDKLAAGSDQLIGSVHVNTILVSPAADVSAGGAGGGGGGRQSGGSKRTSPATVPGEIEGDDDDDDDVASSNYHSLAATGSSTSSGGVSGAAVPPEAASVGRSSSHSMRPAATALVVGGERPSSSATVTLNSDGHVGVSRPVPNYGTTATGELPRRISSNEHKHPTADRKASIPASVAEAKTASEGDGAVSTAALIRSIWPCVVSLVFTMIGSVLISSCFSYLTPIGSEHESSSTGRESIQLDLIVFYVRLLGDMTGRALCMMLPAYALIRSRRVLVVLTILRTAVFCPVYFWYILECRSSGTCHTNTGIVCGVFGFAVLTGVLVTSSFQLAPQLVVLTTDSSLAAATSSSRRIAVAQLMNIAFQIAVLIGLGGAFVIRYTLLDRMS